MTASKNRVQTDIAVIGAGPAGSSAAAILCDQGWRVSVIERSHFPRFSIGESLLPQCMESLEAAGMLAPLEAAGFQVKRGAGFAERERFGRYEFADQFTPGWGWTWHVTRADFDDILAREASARGADVRFGETIERVDFSTPGAPQLTVTGESGESYLLDARFVCDASGFGRVLPRMLGLERAVDAPPRAAMFTHVTDHINAPDYRRDDILIAIHPEHPGVWYWLIAFAGGRASVGLVGDPEFINREAADADRLQALIAQEPHMARLLVNAEYDSPVRSTANYAVGVSALYGRDFALLGNAGEFLDPVFSSGVTLALKSAALAAGLIDRQLRGEAPDWDGEYEVPLRHGLRVFRTFVESWYRGELKHAFFNIDPDPEIRSKIGSVLAGYVWDRKNPFADKPERRLRALCNVCAPY